MFWENYAAYREVLSYLVFGVTLLFFLLGLMGSLLPLVPGSALILAGCVWQASLGDKDLGVWSWVFLVGLFILSLVTEKLSGILGAKTFGASKVGIIGAIVGAVVGSLCFTPLVGLTVAPFIGAILGEVFFGKKKLFSAAWAGTGATLGLITGYVLEFCLGVVMILYFCFAYFTA